MKAVKTENSNHNFGPPEGTLLKVRNSLISRVSGSKMEDVEGRSLGVGNFR
jgi:hypothetical protein